MTEPSVYPGTDDDTDVEPDRRATTGTSRWQKAVGGLGLVVAVWVGSETYEAVYGDFGGGPGPGQDTPVENQDHEIDTDDGDQDPSQGNHP